MSAGEDRPAAEGSAATPGSAEVAANPASADGQEMVDETGKQVRALRERDLLGLGLLTVLLLLPVTLPVSALRELVQDRFMVSELQTSLFMSINLVGAVLCAPLAGAVADSLGRRKMVIVFALLLDALCLLAMCAPMPFVVFLGIRFVEGCAHISALSLLLSLSADRAPKHLRGKVMGALGCGISLGVAIGAPMGGVLVDRGVELLGEPGVMLPFQVGSAILLGAALLAVVLLRDVSTQTRRAGFRQVASAVVREKSLRIPLAFAFADRFTVGFFVTTFPLYLKRIFEASSMQVGFLLMLLLLPFSLLSYPMGRLAERVSRTWMVGGGSLLYGLLLMTLGLWDVASLPWLMFVLGVLSAVMFVPSLILVLDLATPQTRSTSLGGFNAAGSLGFIVGPLVGGLVSQTVAGDFGWQAGYRSAFAVAGAVEVLCVLLVIRAMRRLVRDGRTT